MTPWYTPLMTRFVIWRERDGVLSVDRERERGGEEKDASVVRERPTHLDRFEMVHVESIAKLVDSSRAVEGITRVRTRSNAHKREVLTFYRTRPTRDDRLRACTTGKVSQELDEG